MHTHPHTCTHAKLSTMILHTYIHMRVVGWIYIFIRSKNMCTAKHAYMHDDIYIYIFIRSRVVGWTYEYVNIC